MKLFLISQDLNDGYDTYDSAVVAARTEEEARDTHPSGGLLEDKPSYRGTVYLYHGDWLYREDRNKITVKYIGQAARGTKAGVICASFNAG